MRGILVPTPGLPVMRSAAAAAIVALAICAAAPAGEPAPAGGQAVLTEASYWRCNWVWKTPLVRVGKELQECPNTTWGPTFAARSALPPDGWIQPDFDDSSWSRWRGEEVRGTKADYGFRVSPAVAAQCLRGRFVVENPSAASGLTLSLAYRGGTVVYLNGRELVRGHLPKEGRLGFDALAEDYPPEAFEHAEVIRGSKCILAEFGQPEKFREGVEKRIRRLENVAIDGKLLRKGVNVLAVELLRAPYYGSGIQRESLNHRSTWSPCGLISLDLKAASGVRPNVSRPAGIQVWTSSAAVRSSPADYADPAEPMSPISIVAARNGTFDGKAVVSSSGALQGVKATMSDLTQKGGIGKIPASGIKVLYSVRDDRNTLRYRNLVDGGFWDTLLEAPPAAVEPAKSRRGQPLGAVQPIVVKVRVPAEAPAGEYEGKLTVNPGSGAPVEVPVRLKVIDWKLPDPRDFESHMALIQSPDSVAMEYKVPLWSDRHWALMEKSFELLGEVGGRYAWIPLICRTNFGNEQSMVRWVRKQGSGVSVQVSVDGKKAPAAPDTRNLTPDTYAYDFSVFDRYLDLAQKHQKLDVVCLYVWDRYTGMNSWGRVNERGSRANAPVKVTLLTDPKTGACEEMDGPAWEDPGAKAFWEPVYKGVLARLEKRGLLPVTMMGVSAEGWQPTKEAMDHFKTLMPGIRWIWNGHPQAPGNIQGIQVGYETNVYIMPLPPPAPWDAKRKFAWQNPTVRDMFPRGGCEPTLYQTSPLAEYRTFPEIALQSFSYGAHYNGLGRTGADFWPVLEPPSKRTTGKRSETVNGRYAESCWNQLNMNTATEAVLAPGPDGPASTERFENLREGVQEAEARIFIERAVMSGRLDAALTKKCQDLLDERTWHLHCAVAGQDPGWNWLEGGGLAGMRERLFAAAAEVAGKLGGK